MYTPIDREMVLNQLVESFRRRKDVLSVVLVGSGVLGFKDRYSDIDLAVVVSTDDLKEIYKSTQETINRLHDIVISQSTIGRPLQLFLLDNYLEIDIGYYTFDTLSARRENFKVIYDKTGKVEQKLIDSWSENCKRNKGTTENIDMAKIIKEMDNNLWYNVMHSIISFKRNDKYRCYFELNEIRNMVIDLIAKRNNIESKRYRQINELNSNERAKIDNMLLFPKSGNELFILLHNMLDCLFEEFEYWKIVEGISYTSDKLFLDDFVNENLC